jgi:hypothetical protein
VRRPCRVPAATSRLVLGNIFAEDAFVALQLPLVIRAVGEPFGEACLRVDGTGRHGDARLLTGGYDFLLAKLAVAENSDKGNEHGDLSLLRNHPVKSLHAGFMPYLSFTPEKFAVPILS